MVQLKFLQEPNNKLFKIIAYLILGALITGYAGASGWVFSQVMNRPSILENYQKKQDAINQQIRFEKELIEHKTDTCKRIDKLEDFMDRRFNKLDDLVLEFMKQHQGVDNKFNSKLNQRLTEE